MHKKWVMQCGTTIPIAPTVTYLKTTPLGEFCCLLLKDVHEKFHKDILVPMTLLRKESYCIIEKLYREGIDTRLVVLEAGYQTVHTVSWPAARRRSAGAWRTSSWRV